MAESAFAPGHGPTSHDNFVYSYVPYQSSLPGIGDSFFLVIYCNTSYIYLVGL